MKKYLLKFGLTMALLGAWLDPLSASPMPPEIGSIMKSTDQTIGAWSIFERGFWCFPVSDSCSFTLLSSDRDIVVAVTRVIDRNTAGGHLSDSIVQTFEVKERRGEEFADCGYKNAVIGLLNKHAKYVRIFYMDGAKLSSVTKKYKANPPCDVGEN